MWVFGCMRKVFVYLVLRFGVSDGLLQLHCFSLPPPSVVLAVVCFIVVCILDMMLTHIVYYGVYDFY